MYWNINELKGMVEYCDKTVNAAKAAGSAEEELDWLQKFIQEFQAITAPLVHLVSILCVKET